MRKMISGHSCLSFSAVLVVLFVGGVMQAQNARWVCAVRFAQRTYTLTGSGENIWFTSDAFQFAWKQISGDSALTADVALPAKGGNAS
jgi:hypothetical protein